MEIQASLFSIWNVFFFLELYGALRITNPKYRSIRLFLAFCALRSAILFILLDDKQAYWDFGWATKEIEMIWLALIASKVAGWTDERFEKPMRLPAFGIAAFAFHNLWTKGWPFYSEGVQMQIFQKDAQMLILVTVLVGCFLLLRTIDLRLTAAVATLAASGLISAQSFLAGHFLPNVATAVWIAGLGALLIALKGTPRQLDTFPAQESHTPQSQWLSQNLESTPIPESWPSREWTA